MLLYFGSTNLYALTNIEQLSTWGAPKLALKILNIQQKNILAGSEEYSINLEQQLEIISHHKLYQQGFDSLQKLSKKSSQFLNNPQKHYLKTKIATLLMMLGRYKKAQKYIEILSKNAIRPATKYRKIWQKYLIQSYAKNGYNRLALKTMKRYQKNYTDKSDDFYELQQSIYYQTKQYRKINIKNTNNSNLQIIFALTKLQNRKNINKVNREIVSKLQNEDPSNQTKYQYYLILSKIAQKTNKPRQNLLTTMQAAELYPKINEKYSHILPFSADDLWQAYYDYGKFIVKNNNIHPQQSSKIHQLSLELEDPRPYASLSLIVFLWAQAENRNTQNKLSDSFFALCKQTENCPTQLNFLFLQSSFFDIKTIPQNIKYELIEQLMQDKKTQQVADIIEQTYDAPSDKDEYIWHITKAKILIQVGKIKPAIKTVNNILDNNISYDDQQMDQISQVIFDLQALKQHKEVILLFDKIKQRDISVMRIREILFWQAESYDGLGKYENAAYHYLQSAYQIDKSGADQWGQTARFNAAESLTRTKFITDANNIYKKLLTITTNKQRLLIIQSRIEKTRSK